MEKNSSDNNFKYVDQKVYAYPHRVQLYNPEGNPHVIEDPDLWVACKINSTRKKQFASELYFEKLKLSLEKRQRFIEAVRDHSWNRLHMGALVVGGSDVEMRIASLVSSAIALGKFYKIQQQTRRSVVLDEVFLPDSLKESKETLQSIENRFELYYNVTNPRKGKIKGFDQYVQDIFKILPLSTMTRIVGNWDLRTVLQYSRWDKINYLPSSVVDFAKKLRSKISNAYPLMSKSFIVSERMSKEQAHMLRTLVKSNDLTDEPMLWYNDHSFLLPKNPFYEKIHHQYDLEIIRKKEGPVAKLIGYYGPEKPTLDDLLELFNSKKESSKSILEVNYLVFASKIDFSGAIDTWRHTRNNRLVEPIYHALEKGITTSVPKIFERGGSDRTVNYRDKIIEASKDAVKIYYELVGEGISPKEAIHVLPHNIELFQIEAMDLFSFLNVMALRTCIHARPEVQKWAKNLLQEAGKTKELKGIEDLNPDKILARGIQFGYCMEMGNCKKCGDIFYVPDPF